MNFITHIKSNIGRTIRSFREAAVILLVIVIAATQVSPAFAATYTFTQTGWSGGAAPAAVAADPANRTGWTSYQSASSSIIAGATITLASSSSSLTQTDNGTSTTGFNLAGSSFATTTVTGAGSGASVGLTKTDTANAWTTMANTPGVAGLNAAAYDGNGNIFMSQGGTNAFWKYSIASNTWTTMANLPAAGQRNAAAYDGNGNIFMTQSNGTNAFWKYTIATNVWTVMANTLSTTTDSAMTYDGNGNIFASKGYGATDFWKYNIATNVWSAMTSLPDVSYYGKMVYVGNGDIYMNEGYNGSASTNVFWKYNITSNAWTTMAAMPGSSMLGSMSYDGNGTIYASRGMRTNFSNSPSTDFWKYTIASNTWTVMAALPANSAYSAAVYDGNGHVFMNQGNDYVSGNTAAFWKYSIYDLYPSSGTYTSGIIDAGGSVANWGNLSWTNSGSASTTVSIMARSGNQANLSDAPAFGNDAWSYWGTYSTANGGFHAPRGVAVDTSGNVYVTDYSSNRIQKFDSSGTYLTKWGSYGAGNGQFNSPLGVAVDTSGNVYVADISDRIQKFTSSGTYLTQWGTNGTGNGQFDHPNGVAVDTSGNVYVADYSNNRIQKFDSSGTYLTQWGSYGAGNGQFVGPSGVAVDTSGNVYVADNGNNRIQKFTSSGAYLTQWGTNGTGNGQFKVPQGVAVDTSGNVYVADISNNRIQKFDSSGTYLAKWGTVGTSTGQFQAPQYIAVNASGNVYVSDGNNYRIAKLIPGTQSTSVSPASLSALGVNPGTRYIQYMAMVSTANTAQTPSLDNVTIGYTQYATTLPLLVSTPYDSGQSSNAVSGLNWKEIVPTGTGVQIMLRAASTSALLSSAAWSSAITDATPGCANNSGTIVCGAGAIPSNLATTTGNEWFQYMVMGVSSGQYTPTVSEVDVQYTYNSPPNFQATPVASQVATSTDPHWGWVKIPFAPRDTDTVSNLATTTFTYNGGTPIPASDIQIYDAGNTPVSSPLAVASSTYTAYTAYWNVASTTPGIVSSTTTVSITANDGQPINNVFSTTTGSFAVDTKMPTAPFYFDAGIAGQANSGLATIGTPTDANAVQYYLTDGSTTTGFANISATTTVPWTFDSAETAKSLSLVLRDSFGNTATTTHTTTPPSDPGSFLIQDVSKVSTSDWRLYIGWGVSTSSQFSAYMLEYATSTDNTNYGPYSVAANIATISTNFFVHTNLNTSLYYRYRLGIMNLGGDMSVRSNAYTTARPDGVQNFGEGGGGSVATAANITNVGATSAGSGIETISYTLTDPSYGGKVNPSYEGYLLYTIGTTFASMPNASSVTVSDATHLPNTGFIQINNEILGYTGKTGNTLNNVVRGTWPTTATTRQTRQNTSFFAGTPIWVVSTAPITATSSAAILNGVNGTITWNTINETALAGSVYANMGLRVLFHDNQLVSSGPLTTQSDLSNDGILGSLDMSAPVIGFAGASASTSESATSSSIISINLNKAYPLNSAITYAVTGGTGVLNTDYSIASTTGTLTIPAGATSTTLSIQPLPDHIFGPDKTIILSLSAPVNATLGSNSIYTFTVREADAQPAIQFASSSSVGPETTANYSIPVMISATSTATTTVVYSVSTSTAVLGKDFSLSTGTLSIPAGSTTASIPLALLNDFRHFDYATEYKYPTVVLDQMKGLLAKYENL